MTYGLNDVGERAGRTARPLWPVVAPLALMLASDYKLRRRDEAAAISGRPDVFVLLEIAVYAAVALFLLWRFRPAMRVQRTTGLLFAGWAFTCVLALSALYSPYPTLGVVRAAQLVVACSLGATLARHATRGDFHRLAHAFLAVVLASVAVGVVHPFPRSLVTAERFNWLYVHQVVVGIYLAIAVLLTLNYLLGRHQARPGPRWATAAYGVLLVVFVSALLATETRGAVVGCVLGACAMAATSVDPRRRTDLLFVAVPVIALVAVALGPSIVEFLVRGESVERLSTLNSRTDLWALALAAVAVQPLFGYGLGASRGLFLESTNLGGGHNAFVNVLVDTGLVGGLCFCVLLIVLARRLSALARAHRARSDAPVLLAVLVMLVVDAITVEFLAAPANVASTWLFLMLGWVTTLDRSDGRPVVGPRVSPGPTARAGHATPAVLRA